MQILNSNIQLLKAIISQQVSPKIVLVLSSLVRSSIRTQAESQDSVKVPSLHEFITGVVDGSQVSIAVIYVAMIYINRIRPKLSKNFIGLYCTGHRLVLAAIILAEKSLCDVSMRNISWQKHAKSFRLDEINLMERQFLGLLEYKLEISPEQLFDMVRITELFKKPTRPDTMSHRATAAPVPRLRGKLSKTEVDRQQPYQTISRSSSETNMEVTESLRKSAKNIRIPSMQTGSLPKYIPSSGYNVRN